jgi:hypothetical protein
MGRTSRRSEAHPQLVSLHVQEERNRWGARSDHGYAVRQVSETVHSIHTGEEPLNKGDTCWSCLVQNFFLNMCVHEQILGLYYVYIIRGNPVDISMYFASRRQHA